MPSMFGFGQREVQDRFSMRALGRPYRFVPPRHGALVPRLLRTALPWYLRYKYGIEEWEVRGAERLRVSLLANHGVLLAGNHSRDSDSVAVGLISIPARTNLHIMAGWHVLLESRFQAWAIQRSGGFSVCREKADRQSVRTAIDLAAHTSRPLAIFPEGYVTRTNDKLAALQEGVGLIARRAAAQRAKDDGGRVVIHPTAIKYQFNGDLAAAARPMLEDLEQFLGLSKGKVPLIERLERAREAFVTLRGCEPRDGPLEKRVPRLIEALLSPLEEEWKGAKDSSDVYERVRRLRGSILDHVVAHPEGDMAPFRRQLNDCTQALQLATSDPSPLSDTPTIEHFMETLDALEEDTRGSIRVNRPWRLMIDIGDAITVEPKGESPMSRLREALEGQLEALAAELNQPLPKGPT